MIKEAFEVIWMSLRDLWEELYYLVIANILWFFLGLGLPLLLLEVEHDAARVAMGILILLALPPATAAMFHVTNRVARATTFHISDFFVAYKLYWWRSWLWALGNALVAYMIHVDLQFYPQLIQNVVGIAIAMFFLFLFAFWLLMQIYFWPMLIQQEKPNILQAWRNAAILVLAKPLYALLIGAFSVLAWYLSARAYFVPMGLITMGLQGVLASNALLTLLVKLGKIQPVRPPEIYRRR
jgi:uncharacterized membrane protein YesL